MRVECYYNLHKHVFSVRALEGPDKGRVIGHCNRVLLKGVSFVVQKAGREKVLRTGQKNVHAFVRGTLVDQADVDLEAHVLKTGVSVFYNPRHDSTFRLMAAPIPIHAAPETLLCKQMGKARIYATLNPDQKGA
jgi:hypothetical protein